MTTIVRVAALSAMLLLVGGAASAGPITSNTALPVHAGELIVREQVIWMRATRDPSPLNRELDVVMAPTVLVYGPTSRLMFMGVLPWLYKGIEVTTPDGREKRHTSGFGDLMTVARVTALAVDRPHETIRLAPFGGLKLPTGAQNEADDLGRFPQPFQLGTGSWDPFAGAVFTWQTLRWELDADAAYRRNTEMNDFQAGDEARSNVSFQYRLVPWGRLGPGLPSYVFGVLETTAVWQGKDRVAGVDDPDSGGFTGYVTPGVQWISVRTIIEAAVQVPVVQDLNGQGLGHDHSAILSVRRSW